MRSFCLPCWPPLPWSAPLYFLLRQGLQLPVHEIVIFTVLIAFVNVLTLFRTFKIPKIQTFCRILAFGYKDIKIVTLVYGYVFLQVNPARIHALDNFMQATLQMI